MTTNTPLSSETVSLPLAIDLFCGLGGWTEGLLAEGYDVIGFDIECHCYGDAKYPAQLVLQDVRTLHGRQFKGAALIVASPPCQAYSYRAMPWRRAKALPPPDNTLFEACFRIQREASEATGQRIPLVVENVRGAEKYVGRARWNYGSYYLWGDVPALMPMILRHAKVPGQDWNRFSKTGEVSPHWRIEGIKNTGGSWFNVAHNTTSGKGRNPDGRNHPGKSLDGRNDPRDHLKVGGRWFYGLDRGERNPATHGSKSSKRQAASAMIAKIPFHLARHIAASWKPRIAA